MPMPMPVDGLAPIVGDVLRLRGLPFTATEEDIRTFFGDYTLKQMVICKRNGRSTGEAYVALSSPAAAAEALKLLQKKHIGRRYIELFPSTDAELKQHKAQSDEGRAKGFFLRLRGLPYAATAADVMRFLGDNAELARGPDSIVFTFTSAGRPTGEAYVEFAHEEAQKEALKRHKEMLGTRYIEIFVSSRFDLQQALQQARYNPNQAMLMQRKRWFAQQQAAPNMAGLHGVGGDNPMLRVPKQMQYAPPNVDDLTEYLRGLNVAGAGGAQLGAGAGGVDGGAGMPANMGYLPSDDLANMQRSAQQHMRGGGNGGNRYYQGLPQDAQQAGLQGLEAPYYVPQQVLHQQGAGWNPQLAGHFGGAAVNQNWQGRGYGNAQLPTGWAGAQLGNANHFPVVGNQRGPNPNYLGVPQAQVYEGTEPLMTPDGVMGGQTGAETY